MRLSTLVLQVAQLCNMECDYCYAQRETGAGTYGHPSVMTEAIAARAVDFLLQAAGEKAHIVFFGGEPLLNFNLIKYVVDYSREQFSRSGKGIDYELITNGVLLSSDVISYLAANTLSVQVSLDGPKEIHDKARRLPGGQGTYDLISENVKNLLAACKELVSVRSTVTKDGIHCYDTIKHLLDLGFRRINLTPVYTRNSNYRLTAEDIEVVNREFALHGKRFLEEALQYRLLNDGQLLDVIRLLRFIGDHTSQRERFCGAGDSLLSVSSDGGIYPCHAFVGFPEYNCGNVLSSVNDEKLASFTNMTSVNNKTKCLTCPEKWICGGGCNYAAFEMNGDVTVPYEVMCSFLRNLYRLGGSIFNSLKHQDPGIVEYLCKYDEMNPLREQLTSLLRGDAP